jgi:hypothetical protein
LGLLPAFGLGEGKIRYQGNAKKITGLSNGLPALASGSSKQPIIAMLDFLVH